jgi:hypothetical protein
MGVPTYPAMPTTGGQNYTVFQVIVPDGLYEVADLNKYLQYIFIHNGHYYVNAAGQNVYFAEFIVNPSNYSIQLNTYPVLTTTQVTAAGGTFPLAVNTLNPTVQNYGTPTNNNISLYMYNPVSANASNPTFGANNFGLLIGYAQGWGSNNTGDAFNYNNGGTVVPATAALKSTNQSYRSSITPEIQPNPVLYVAASNIENNYANPSTIIGTITPQVAFGDLISITPPQFSWNKLLSGTYQGLRLALLGSDFRDITLLDPNITIVLALRNTKDNPAVDLLNTAAGGK